MKSLSSILAIVLTLGSVGCRIDFVDPSIPEDARLSVFLDGQDLSGGVLRLRAQLVPGVRPSGGERQADSTLIVLGEALRARPGEFPTATGLIWDDTLVVNRTGLDAVAVVPPEVAGIMRPPTLHLPIRRVAGSGSSKAWVPGTDLVLVMAPAADSSAIRDGQWRLDVVGWDEDGTERSLAEVVARTAVPDTIRVDAAWLGVVALDSLEATLHVNIRCGSTTQDSVYVAEASLAQRLTWRISVTRPSFSATVIQRTPNHDPHEPSHPPRRDQGLVRLQPLGPRRDLGRRGGAGLGTAPPTRVGELPDAS